MRWGAQTPVLELKGAAEGGIKGCRDPESLLQSLTSVSARRHVIDKWSDHFKNNNDEEQSLSLSRSPSTWWTDKKLRLQEEQGLQTKQGKPVAILLVPTSHSFGSLGPMI